MILVTGTPGHAGGTLVNRPSQWFATSRPRSGEIVPPLDPAAGDPMPDQ
jgi:hypothetical protein